MHGLTGGGWKRSVDHGRRRKVPGGNAGHERRDLPSINATAPAAHPTEPRFQVELTSACPFRYRRRAGYAMQLASAAEARRGGS